MPHEHKSLIGRRAEIDALDQVLSAVRAGESTVLVLHGEAGIGKTALLDYLAEHAVGCRIIRTAGVESEIELAYAALTQLCAPMLNRLDHLPPPQRDALQTAFGLSTGPPPYRLLVGLGVLSLFSDVAEVQPLVCLIDDLQWLDQASAQALAFVARRLVAESVGLIVATRIPDPELSILPKMQVHGLGMADARALLDAVLTAPLDERIRDQIIAETGGNPLALLRLSHDLTVPELAGGFGLPAAARLSAAMEESFRREVASVPDQTQRLLLLAAADPLGDPGLVWRAAEQLGIEPAAAAPAIEAGLVEFGIRVRFRHPLVRSAAYRSASPQARQSVHCALAQATDPELNPDCRAWHLAQSVTGPDPDVADELERSADRARARGGVAAAAAFYERATMLTEDSTVRIQRALAAASAKVEAGANDSAIDLLILAERLPLSDLQHARADLIRAQLAHVTNRGSDAPPLLLKAAQRLERIDAPLSLATYLEALSAAMFAARLASGDGVFDVARAAQASPRPPNPVLPDLLLDGFSTYFIDGYATALPVLRRAITAARPLTSSDKQLRCLWLAGIAALHVWDDESWDEVSMRHVEAARAAGVLTELSLALSSRVVMHLFAGDLTAAGSGVLEAQTVTEATGDKLSPYGALGLAAFRGDQKTASELTEAMMRDAMSRGEGIGLTVTEWAESVLNNSRGDFDKAMVAAQRAFEHPADVGVSVWATVELVEAAARSGVLDAATDALARLIDMTSASGTDWALGVQARSRALLSDGPEADRLYREAVERLGRTRLRTELARAHLLYGEWLRREDRRTDARTQLRTAYEMFDAMGMEAFAGRVRRELVAAGGTVRNRTAAPVVGEQLTAQEAQVARLARDGLSNPEIGARMFISGRTVQYHLRKVFAKLGITSRSQLDRAFPAQRLH